MSGQDTLRLGMPSHHMGLLGLGFRVRGSTGVLGCSGRGMLQGGLLLAGSHMGLDGKPLAMLPLSLVISLLL